MKNHSFLALSLAAVALLGVAKAESYQVTGQVVEVTDTKIVIEKGKEKWEIARNGETKITGEPKVGSKVTVHYTMTATSIEVKEAKAKDGEKAKPKPEVKPEAKPAPAKKAA